MAKPNSNLKGKRLPPAKRKSVKSQIRDIERLLKKVATLPESVVLAKQHELAQLQQTAEAHHRQERERKMAVRYHKVKFFERQKVERKLAQAMKELQVAHARAGAGSDGSAAARGDRKAAPLTHSDSEGEGERARANADETPDQAVERAEQRMARLRDMEMYIKHFPKGEKYVSLFKGDEDDADRKVKVARLMALVKANLADAATAAAGGAPDAGAAEADDLDDEDDPDGMGVSASKLAAKQKQKHAVAKGPRGVAAKGKPSSARAAGSMSSPAVLATQGGGRNVDVAATEEAGEGQEEEEAAEERDDFFMGSSDEEGEGSEGGEGHDEEGGMEEGDGRNKASRGWRGRGRGSSGRGWGFGNNSAPRGRPRDGGRSRGGGYGGGGHEGFLVAKRGRGEGGSYYQTGQRRSDDARHPAGDVVVHGMGAYGPRGRGRGTARGGTTAGGDRAGAHVHSKTSGADARVGKVAGQGAAVPPPRKAPKDLHETLKLKVPTEKRDAGSIPKGAADAAADDGGKRKRKRKHRKKKPQ